MQALSWGKAIRRWLNRNKKNIDAFLGLFLLNYLLISALLIPGLFITTLSNMMSSIPTIYLFSVFNNSKVLDDFISNFTNKVVKVNVCADVCPITLYNATLASNITHLTQLKKVIITIDNPQNVPTFIKLYSNKTEEWAFTPYSVRINVTFADFLGVEVFPFSAFSDASPRKLFFQNDGNSTVHISSQQGGALFQFFSVLVALGATLATMGIIK